MTSNTSPITTAREALTPLATIQQELETLALFAAPGYGNEARRQAMILTGRFASILELAEKLKSALEVTQDEGLTEIARLEADVEKLKAERDVNDAIAQKLIDWLVEHNHFDRGEEMLVNDVKALLDDVSANYEFDAEVMKVQKDAEITRLTSQLEQAERVISSFANCLFGGSPGPAHFAAASQWIKDRQAKGEG